MVDQKKPWFRIRLRDSEVTPWHFFQAMISNVCHQKSVKKVKKCKKSKVKAFFFLVGGQTGEDCLPYLTDGLKSRVCHWLNRDLEGSFVFLWENLQRYLSVRKWLRNIRKQAKKKKKEGTKSFEDLASSVSPVIRKERCQASKERSPTIAKLQLFEPETVLGIQRKENWVTSSLFFEESNLECWEKTVADPGFEWGPGAVTRLKCEHDKWCDREAITRGRSPRFSRGVRGHAPPENFENRDAQICVFSPFGSIFEPE